MSPTPAQVPRLARLLGSFLLRRPQPPAPLKLWVDLTSRCNLACAACPQRGLSEDQRRDMDPALLAGLVDQVRDLGIARVNLFHRGEPLLHPQLPLWVRRFRGAGARVALHSNATLLDRERVAGLLWSRPESLTLSIDSLDPEIYAAARVGADLERTLAGVERLLRGRWALGGGRPRVTLLTMGAKPPSAAHPVLTRLRSLGLDVHRHRRPHNWGGLVGPAPRRPGFRGGWPTRKPAVCTFPWYALTVLSDGRVSPCPQDFNGQIVLGDLRRRSLAQIWRGWEATNLRAAQGGGVVGAYAPCASCDRVWRRNLGGVPLVEIKGFLKN